MVLLLKSTDSGISRSWSQARSRCVSFTRSGSYGFGRTHSYSKRG
jgi:hypothetical protein